jgi:hypothetical protein
MGGWFARKRGGPLIALPPERWASFPDGGTLFVRRPQVKQGDQIRLSDMTIIDVPPGHTVAVLSPEDVANSSPEGK